MLRHSREMTRFQRDRIIQKRKNNWLTKWWWLGGQAPPDNFFSKHHFTDCSCLVCQGEPYKRDKFDWKRAVEDQDYAALAKNDKPKTWW